MSYSALTGYLQTQFNYQVSGTQVSTGLPFPPASVSNQFQIKQSYGLGSGAGAVNIISAFIQAISASSGATINLQSLTDVLGATVTSMTKLKEYLFCLLNATQDSVNGTAAASVAIGNAGSNQCPLAMSSTTTTYTVNNGGNWAHGDPGASGITVSSTVKNVLVTNNDAGLAAAVLCAFGGA